MKGRATAAYASRPESSRGRVHAEPESPTRTAFQRDRDRIIHSAAFRRLAHKTQVFVYHEGDHYRTRLTHSLEVSQIARSITRMLGGDDDLAEALALAHDLGHTPFGHTGEDILAELMADYGGFDHNAQSLRVVTRLERRYAAFDGLNLTWETLEGLAKHNGPLITPDVDASRLPHAVGVVAAEVDLGLASHASLEAQVAAVSDDIAYNNHDLDDGLRAGLFSIADLREIDIVREAIDRVGRECGPLDDARAIHETMRRLISWMVEDVIGATSSRIAALAPDTPDAIRAAGHTVADFSDAMRAQIRSLRGFLFDHMYRHERVRHDREIAARIVRELFGFYLRDPGQLPEEWRRDLAESDERARARRVADFIAGMTDPFATRQYEAQFAPIPEFG